MNNKKMNKKGFTIVELVIVIAVIAILAGVMIPTFGGIIKTAEKSNVFQGATAAYKEAYGVAISDGEIDEKDVNIEAGDGAYKFTFAQAQGKTGLGMDDLTCTVTIVDTEIAAKWVVSVSGSTVTVTEKPAA